MSVINKMLRDLDGRLVTGPIHDQDKKDPVGMTSGTLIAKNSAPVMPKMGTLKIVVMLIALTLLLSAGVLAWWYQTQNQASLHTAEPVMIVTAPVKSTPAFVTPQAAVAVVVASPVRAMDTPNQASAKIVQTDASLKMDNTLAEVPRHATPPKPFATERTLPVSVALPTGRSMPQLDAPKNALPNITRRSPALDALAQAQNLWRAGSREAAIDLVRETMVVAEQANLTDASAANNFVLVSLARELGRMEMAEGRVSQVLSLLTRLEPALSGDADVWALRGNAAQRVGRHEESASAYLAALKLRPNEPRWMLGAAVSMAAQGKTVRAAEMAEKARIGGAMSTEVATYLRQLGVVVREP